MWSHHGNNNFKKIDCGILHFLSKEEKEVQIEVSEVIQSQQTASVAATRHKTNVYTCSSMMVAYCMWLYFVTLNQSDPCDPSSSLRDRTRVTYIIFHSAGLDCQDSFFQN